MLSNSSVLFGLSTAQRAINRAAVTSKSRAPLSAPSQLQGHLPDVLCHGKEAKAICNEHALF